MGNQEDLQRFKDAQEGMYSTALEEIRGGMKRSHWMWYIFPQIEGLGRSSRSMRYAIRDLEEAKRYLGDEVLRGRLVEICEALLGLPGNDATAVMGFPDDMKLRSSMTLFAEADPRVGVFQRVLDKYFGGKKDGSTLALLGRT